jgi:Nucleotide-diphospho-sugar transferase
MSLSWYYVYSQRYEVLHYMLQDTIKDTRFNVVPLFVDQSEFNKTTYKKNADHFFAGCFIKQEIIVRILKKLPTGTYFLFTDVDMVILNDDGLYDFFKTYMDRGIDMVYMWEGSDSNSDIKNCNVGFALLKACPQTIAFFETVLEKAPTSQNMYDMQVMLPLFSEFPGKIELFDKNVICLSNYFNETEPKSGIKVVQVLCSNNKDYHHNMYQKYCGIKAFRLPIEKYITMALENGRTCDELGIPS